MVPFWPEPLPDPLHELLLNSLLVDFAVGFTFFTTLTFAVLERRFEHRRAAVLMSASTGLALAVGLVSWELTAGVSIRSLGPIAVALALLALALVSFKAFSRIGNSAAAGVLSLGIAVILAHMLGVGWLPTSQWLVSLAFLALMGGAMWMLLPAMPRFQAAGQEGTHHHKHGVNGSMSQQDVSDLYRGLDTSEQLANEMDMTARTGHWLKDRPDLQKQVRERLDQMLPEPGWITQQLAGLREKLQLMKTGHLARIRELESRMSGVPDDVRRRATREMKDRIKETELEKRLERLDKTAAALEQRINKLLKRAEHEIDHHKYQDLSSTLEEASKLQHQVSQLMKRITATDNKVSQVAKKIADETTPQHEGGDA